MLRYRFSIRSDLKGAKGRFSLRLLVRLLNAYAFVQGFLELGIQGKYFMNSLFKVLSTLGNQPLEG